MTQESGVGDKVRIARKLAGWSQEKLAREANFSASLVRKVERGRAPASPAFVAACARALRVNLADLLDQPYPRQTRDERQVHAGVPDIRRELAAYKIEPDDTMNARPERELAADIAKASGLRHSVDLGDLGTLLPGLLADLRVAWHSAAGAERERIFGLLAEAFAATGQLVYKLGYIDLSSLCVERYEWAAAQSGDPLAVLAGDYQRAGELICTADWSTALRFLESSRATIESDINGSDPAVLSMWGNLHLKSGLAAARAGRRDLADEHLAEARETAHRIGGDRDDYRLCFGVTNVDIWSVGLAVEMMDGTEAVKRAEQVHFPTTTPRERVGHHYIDLARGYLLHGDRTKAFASLRKAKQNAATQTRYHPMVHETIRVLTRNDARSNESVRGFAAWCGIDRA
ncbi:helix-turn-helix transcriptional regulator [Nocardia abscessus]|uniref:helix-turn-helix domain-containing protein n=1 Tax=Nocardia abscessus TaxID=120957 RepID=UPI001894C58B|nr:helix-turn-helix transcriptional regulator [Nocardia abscessus]MBF6220245.1 helix-turn-helix transcriptional regulator [Nocardia abscessus]